MADQVKADYEVLAAVSQAFKQQADAMKKTEQGLKSKAQGIRSTWIGKGANEFQKEFEQSVVPTYERLVSALNEAGKVTGDISKMFQDAEQEAKTIITIRVE
jgi:WXG100 family type VII secretion target